MVVQRTRVHPRPHLPSALVALQLTSQQVETTPAPFLTTAPLHAGVAMPLANWVMVPLHPVLRRHRRFHSDDPPSPLKQAGISPVLCLTTARFRVGVKITKDSWAEVMKMRPRTLTKQHRDSRFQCRVAAQFLPWTSAITWLVVWWTTAALPVGVNTEVGKRHRSRPSSVMPILPRMSPQADILPVV